eukprot:3132558-Amphidinium_carterae.2
MFAVEMLQGSPTGFILMRCLVRSSMLPAAVVTNDASRINGVVEGRNRHAVRSECNLTFKRLNKGFYTVKRMDASDLNHVEACYAAPLL